MCAEGKRGEHREDPPRSDPDQEYEGILEFDDPAEHAELARALVLSVLGQEDDYSVGKRKKYESIYWRASYEIASGKADAPRFFVLPGIPSGSPLARLPDGRVAFPDGLKDPPSTESLRELYYTGYLDYNSAFFRSERHDFVSVRQGAMVLVPRERSPFFTTSMSECSTLIGVSEKGTVVAHISYSSLQQTKAALDFMRRQGIEPSNIFAVARVEESPGGLKKAVLGITEERLVAAEEYQRLGLPPENIVPFCFGWGEAVNPKDHLPMTVQENLARVIVEPKGFSVSLFNINGGRDRRNTDYRLLKVVPFKV